MPVSAAVLTAKRSLAVLLFLLISASPPACYAAQNITAILAAHPDLAEFSSLLASERLADNISQRNGSPVTVLAVNDTGMAPLKTMPREAIWGHLSLHVLLDCYYDDAKLRRIPPGGSTQLVSTLFSNAPGHTPGIYGMVRIVRFSNASGVGFLPMGLAVGEVGRPAFFVKSVYGGAPYGISVLQVSGVMSTTATDAAQHY